MSLIPLFVSSCAWAPSVSGTGKETGPSVPPSCKKESKRKEVREIVRLTVPVPLGKKPVPKVIRICKETLKKKTSRKKLNSVKSITVPEEWEFAASKENSRSERGGLKTSGSDCIPSIKSCTQEEIEAFNKQNSLMEESVAKRRPKRGFTEEKQKGVEAARHKGDRVVILNVPSDNVTQSLKRRTCTANQAIVAAASGA